MSHLEEHGKVMVGELKVQPAETSFAIISFFVCMRSSSGLWFCLWTRASAVV